MSHLTHVVCFSGVRECQNPSSSRSGSKKRYQDEESKSGTERSQGHRRGLRSGSSRRSHGDEERSMSESTVSPSDRRTSRSSSRKLQLEGERLGSRLRSRSKGGYSQAEGENSSTTVEEQRQLSASQEDKADAPRPAVMNSEMMGPSNFSSKNSDVQKGAEAKVIKRSTSAKKYKKTDPNMMGYRKKKRKKSRAKSMTNYPELTDTESEDESDLRSGDESESEDVEYIEVKIMEAEVSCDSEDRTAMEDVTSAVELASAEPVPEMDTNACPSASINMKAGEENSANSTKEVCEPSSPKNFHKTTSTVLRKKKLESSMIGYVDRRRDFKRRLKKAFHEKCNAGTDTESEDEEPQEFTSIKRRPIRNALDSPIPNYLPILQKEPADDSVPGMILEEAPILHKQTEIMEAVMDEGKLVETAKKLCPIRLPIFRHRKRKCKKIQRKPSLRLDFNEVEYGYVTTDYDEVDSEVEDEVLDDKKHSKLDQAEEGILNGNNHRRESNFASNVMGTDVKFKASTSANLEDTVEMEVEKASGLGNHVQRTGQTTFQNKADTVFRRGRSRLKRTRERNNAEASKEKYMYMKCNDSQIDQSSKDEDVIKAASPGIISLRRSRPRRGHRVGTLPEQSHDLEDQAQSKLKEIGVGDDSSDEEQLFTRVTRSRSRSQCRGRLVKTAEGGKSFTDFNFSSDQPSNEGNNAEDSSISNDKNARKSITERVYTYQNNLENLTLGQTDQCLNDDGTDTMDEQNGNQDGDSAYQPDNFDAYKDSKADDTFLVPELSHQSIGDTVKLRCRVKSINKRGNRTPSPKVSVQPIPSCLSDEKIRNMNNRFSGNVDNSEHTEGRVSKNSEKNNSLLQERTEIPSEIEFSEKSRKSGTPYKVVESSIGNTYRYYLSSKERYWLMSDEEKKAYIKRVRETNQRRYQLKKLANINTSGSMTQEEKLKYKQLLVEMKIEHKLKGKNLTTNAKESCGSLEGGLPRSESEQNMAEGAGIQHVNAEVSDHSVDESTAIKNIHLENIAGKELASCDEEAVREAVKTTAEEDDGKVINWYVGFGGKKKHFHSKKNKRGRFAPRNPKSCSSDEKEPNTNSGNLLRGQKRKHTDLDVESGKMESEHEKMVMEASPVTPKQKRDKHGKFNPRGKWKSPAKATVQDSDVNSVIKASQSNMASGMETNSSEGGTDVSNVHTVAEISVSAEGDKISDPFDFEENEIESSNEENMFNIRTRRNSFHSSSSWFTPKKTPRRSLTKGMESSMSDDEDDQIKGKKMEHSPLPKRLSRSKSLSDLRAYGESSQASDLQTVGVNNMEEAQKYSQKRKRKCTRGRTLRKCKNLLEQEKAVSDTQNLHGNAGMEKEVEDSDVPTRVEEYTNVACSDAGTAFGSLEGEENLNVMNDGHLIRGSDRYSSFSATEDMHSVDGCEMDSDDGEGSMGLDDLPSSPTDVDSSWESSTSPTGYHSEAGKQASGNSPTERPRTPSRRKRFKKPVGFMLRNNFKDMTTEAVQAGFIKRVLDNFERPKKSKMLSFEEVVCQHIMTGYLKAKNDFSNVQRTCYNDHMEASRSGKKIMPRSAKKTPKQSTKYSPHSAKKNVPYSAIKSGRGHVGKACDLNDSSVNVSEDQEILLSSATVVEAKKVLDFGNNGNTACGNKSAYQKTPRKQKYSEGTPKQTYSRPSTPCRKRSSSRPSTPYRERSSSRPSTPYRERSSSRPSTPCREKSYSRPSTPYRQKSYCGPSTPYREKSCSRPSTPFRQKSSSRPSTPCRERNGKTPSKLVKTPAKIISSTSLDNEDFNERRSRSVPRLDYLTDSNSEAVATEKSATLSHHVATPSSRGSSGKRSSSKQPRKSRRCDSTKIVDVFEASRGNDSEFSRSEPSIEDEGCIISETRALLALNAVFSPAREICINMTDNYRSEGSQAVSMDTASGRCATEDPHSENNDEIYYIGSHNQTATPAEWEVTPKVKESTNENLKSIFQNGSPSLQKSPVFDIL